MRRSDGLALSLNSTPGWASVVARSGARSASPEYPHFMVAEMLEQECAEMMPMPSLKFLPQKSQFPL